MNHIRPTNGRENACVQEYSKSMDKYNQVKQSNIWMSKQLEMSYLKDESHGQIELAIKSLDDKSW